MRSMPSAVLAPVDMPPCIRHRPFGIAADRQGVPLRVFAPRLGALLQSLCRLPFLRGLQGPRRLGGIGHFRPGPPGLMAPTLDAAGRDNGLSAWADSNVLMHNLDRLLAASNARMTSALISAAPPGRPASRAMTRCGNSSAGSFRRPRMSASALPSISSRIAAAFAATLSAVEVHSLARQPDAVVQVTSA